MSFIEDIRKIKQSQEGPAFKIERDEANVALKEAILKKVKMGQNHIVLEITEIMRGLDINPGLIEVKIKGKMIPKDLNQEEIRVSTISSFLPVATTSNVEYQFSGSGILLKRQRYSSIDSTKSHSLSEKANWEVAQTQEINLLADYISGQISPENYLALQAIWTGKLKIKPGQNINLKDTVSALFKS